jgi:precorrin-6Y C5,15-methyltransferase (decarboxylating)
MSGDTGFFSGAKSLLSALSGVSAQVIPGISSLCYLCARLQIPWEDIHLVNAHGRKINVPAAAAAHEKTFFVTGGELSVQAICAASIRRAWETRR